MRWTDGLSADVESRLAADAALIAAAPDLLDALKEYQEALSDGLENLGYGRYEQIEEMAAQAIAKAEAS